MDNHCLTMFLDTGSPRNIMDASTYKSFFSDHPINTCNIKLSGIGDKPLKVIGEVNAKYKIGKYHFCDTF